MADKDGFVGFGARLIGVSDIPWFFRWALGILIGLFIIYFYMILHADFADAEGAKALKAFVLDGLKIVFGAVIGILSQSAGLRQNTSSDGSAIQPTPKPDPGA